MTAPRYGATPEEWAHFDMVLGLTPDLLPVVSNPNAVISPTSNLKFLGKVPSRYYGRREVGGIKDWSSHVATSADIERWSAEPDYGISLITRNVRAIDVDIEDADQAFTVAAEIERVLALMLPRRVRTGSSKFLLAFTLPGDLPKRVIKTAHGIIEFLATGQQFIAVGTHPKGQRYEWAGGLPSGIPELTLGQFDELWAWLEAKFAIEPSTTSKTSTKAAKLTGAISSDPNVVALEERGLVKGTAADGKVFIECPFNDDHERESDDTATAYWPANTGGYQRGHFLCLHSPCSHRTDFDFLNAIGMAPDMRDDFEPTALAETEIAKAVRYALVNAMEFKAGIPPAWHIKQVLPHAELVVVYGESGAGKSFFVLDMVAAVARGIEWRGRKVKRGRVVYVAAEGASGFRNRINAYCSVNNIDELDLYVLAGAPSFMEGKDITELINAIRALGDVQLIVIDTLARVSAGANENSGEDMGLVLHHCGTINKVTGATVLLVHHSGKDASKGARGWSGIKAAVDAEMEITRDDANRTATVSKIKDGDGEGEKFGFKLTTISVGMDEDGDDVSSCVVEHGEAVAPKAKAKRLGKLMDLAWRHILELQSPDNKGALMEAVIDAMLESMPKPQGKDNRRTHARGAIERVCAMGKCRIVSPDRIVLLGAEE